MQIVFTIAQLLGLTAYLPAHAPNDVPAVAIIGAGAAGSSAAYHLAQYANFNVDITVFDRNAYVGGRVTSVEFDNQTFELGASIFVKPNSLLVGAVKEFGLTVAKDVPGEESVSAGIWDGTSIVYEIPKASSFWQGLSLVREFGTSPLWGSWYMKRAIGKFLAMYNAPYFPWTSLDAAATGAGLLPDYAGVTAREWLGTSRVGDKFQNVIVQSLTRVNYAINLDDVHCLAAMVCLAAEDGVMQVEGGNSQIFEQFLMRSNAKVKLNHEVHSIIKNGSGWLVDGQWFDYVILASPHKLSGLELDSDVPDVSYTHLHVTYVHTSEPMNTTFFGTNHSMNTVLTTVTPPFAEPDFLSLSHVAKTDTGNHVFKLFSLKHLPNKRVHELLGVPNHAVKKVLRKEWLSYPRMQPVSELPTAEIEANLYYTGSMDPFISTMETNALAGKNAAALLDRRMRETAERRAKSKVTTNSTLS